MTAPFDIAIPDLGGRPLCAETDPDRWFPEKGGDQGRSAKAVCARCPVKDPCLIFALNNDEQFGVWGGMSQQERRRLGRRRAA